MLSTQQEERSSSPALLLLISENTDLHASARSSHRRVLRWTGAAPAAGAGEFDGDPTDPETYCWAADARAVTAVVCLRDDDRSKAVVQALRAVRPDAAMLVLSESTNEAGGDGTLTRAGELRDVLRLDLEDELLRLEAERRVWCLRAFVEGQSVVSILIHPDPDPDALSSAIAVRTILRRNEQNAPIVTTVGMRRPENRRMAELLNVRVTEVTHAELENLERVIVVDSQPPAFGDDGPRVAVIDHHPPETGYTAEFLDLRPEYGAVATMMTEYLRADDEGRIGSALATALLHGIGTDTDGLTRGVMPADVEAYAFLQLHVDRTLLRRIQKPSYPLRAVEAYGRALHRIEIDDGVAVAFTGELTTFDSHILADLADFCMGIEQVTRAVAAGIVDGSLVLTLRDTGHDGGVGNVARRIGELGGNGGGHPTMARAVVPLEAVPGWSFDAAEAVVRQVVSDAGRDPETTRQS